MAEVASCSYSSRTALAKMDGGAHAFPVKVMSNGGELLSSVGRDEGSTKLLYDTLLSINVIEHVQDAFKYLTGLYQTLKPNGLLIFHDRYYTHQEISNGDLYHPIRIKRKVALQDTLFETPTYIKSHYLSFNVRC